MWKEQFKNLLGNSLKVTNKPIMKIINCQLEIKIGQFTQEQLNEVLRKIKDWKAAGFDKILPEVWKTMKFDDFCHIYTEYNREMDKELHSLLPKERWPQNHQELQRHNSTSIAAKVYNSLFHIRIEPEIEKVLRKKNGFWRKWSTTSTYSNNPSNHWRSLCQKSQGTIIVCRFFHGIWFHTQRKEGANTSS